ncbi:ComF family protein [uncultured Subdoligranulum sp.]|uniref:ComF family protein n=1 Tax=uncultured Subdoligranulum sp. TaxID=512298 RepID=UPI0026275F33|nr:phosphoribosyltransferase family protein [uncultured Subdoligranulum sp.]
MRAPDWRYAAEQAAAWLYPRRCPFCGAVLGTDAVQGSVCPQCVEEEERLTHNPPRLPGTEHTFYALNSGLAAYYYSGKVQEAILLCKRGFHPWYARELADRMAVRIWGATPPDKPGRRPKNELFRDMPLYQCIVPVPPHQPLPGVPGLPLLLARRLGILLGIPVETPLYAVRGTAVQKDLTRQQRMQNARKAYACRTDADFGGKRVLLVDDIITTGATVSACAMLLLKAGAVEVTAAAVAASEELPKDKRTSTEKCK